MNSIVARLDFASRWRCPQRFLSMIGYGDKRRLEERVGPRRGCHGSRNPFARTRSSSPRGSRSNTKPASRSEPAAR